MHLNGQCPSVHGVDQASRLIVMLKMIMDLSLLLHDKTITCTCIS